MSQRSTTTTKTTSSFRPDGRVQPESNACVARQVLDLGKGHMVSFPGTSQFTAQGISACGLAAFNFARIGVRIEQDRKNIAEVLNELGTREVVEEIVAICAGWSSNMHLEVENVHELPIFERCLRLTSVEYGLPDPKYFRDLLETMTKIERSTVMIITRPPEIIACFKFANASTVPRSSVVLDNPVFVVFDSHPRPSHPHGAALSFSTSIDHTARTLSEALPTMEDMYDSDDYGWQGQLLTNCSAHVYVARHRRKDHEEAVVRSSLDILVLRAQIDTLKRENEELCTENGRLESEVGRLRASVRQEHEKASKAGALGRMIGRSFGLYSHAAAGPSCSSGPSRSSGPYDRSSDAPSKGSFGLYSHAAAGPSRSSGRHDHSRDVPSKPSIDRTFPAVPPRAPSVNGARSIFADNPPPMPSESPPAYKDLDFDDTLSDDSNDPWIPATRFARQLQSEFDAEDRQLRREQTVLAQYVQTTFQCGICMDELPEDDVAKVEGCVHAMCRACLRGYVVSKIQEHRYPIFCPICTVDVQGKAGVISRMLVEQLGVNEEQSQVLAEMELAEFSIQVHCRKCRRSTFVDREDYSDAINIVCPQVDCIHVWCKKCEQAIAIDGPKHSCDGSSELDHLMKEKGWKHCPSCATPILKESGCNHMLCISPGCNTHFCYICGGMIVRSALNSEIDQSVSAHFRKCMLFEVPA